MSVFSASSESSDNIDMSHVWVSPTPSEARTPVRTRIPEYVRELVKTLDTAGVVRDLDEAAVRRLMYTLKRDKILEDLVRLRDLHTLMAPHFSPDEMRLVEDKFNQTAKGLNEEDHRDSQRLTAMKKRTNVLNRAVAEGLLDEDQDPDLFREIIRAHAKSFTPPASV